MALNQGDHDKNVVKTRISPDLFAEISNRLVDSNYEAERRMQKSAMAVNHPIPSSVVSASVTKRNRSLNNNRNPTDQRLFPRRGGADSIKKAESTGNLIPADPKARTSPPHTRLTTVIPNNNSNNPSQTQPSTFMIPKVFVNY
uniref:Uncharacterized protein n=1 Tax=Panagrolaimus davidi TaxID=227884 RepID=A0A914QPE8_9BILA